MIYVTDRDDSSNRSSGMLAQLEGKAFATVPEAAKVLRSDPRTIRRSIASGAIPAQSVGRRKLVPVAWLRQAAEPEAVSG